MMGVFIKGLKKVPAIVKVHYLNGRRYVEDPYNREWREMVDIPPHGRLIDADKLRAEFPEPADWKNVNEALHHVTGIWAAIDCAETVIPAEEGE